MCGKKDDISGCAKLIFILFLNQTVRSESNNAEPELLILL